MAQVTGRNRLAQETSSTSVGTRTTPVDWYPDDTVSIYEPGQLNARVHYTVTGPPKSHADASVDL